MRIGICQRSAKGWSESFTASGLSGCFDLLQPTIVSDWDEFRPRSLLHRELCKMMFKLVLLLPPNILDVVTLRSDFFWQINCFILLK